MTPYEAATVVIGIGQVLLIAAGLLFMEAGGRRRARAEEHRHAEAMDVHREMMATITAQHEQAMTQHEQARTQHADLHAETMAALTAQHDQVMAQHAETMAALGRDQGPGTGGS